MKKFIIFLLMLSVTSSFLFSKNLSATGLGKTKEEAEENAFIELSKTIRVSIFNEEILSEEEINGNVDFSKYSTTSLQTTKNDFINVEKNFKIQKDPLNNNIYLCTVSINDSSADIYIDLILNKYLVTINSLEKQYDNGKKTLSFENKKNLINNIIETYEDYDMAKYILIALEKFKFELPSPKKTIPIWQNEYQNIVIDYSNDLQKQKNDLNFNKDLSTELINKKIDEINIEIAKANIELNINKQEKEKASKLLYKQKMIETDNEVDNILNSIIDKDIENIKNNISSIQQIKYFEEYNNQYKSIFNKYEELKKEIYDKWEEEKKSGKNEIINKPYLFSELDINNNPTIVATKIRDSEVINFLLEKEKEKLANIKIINNKMVPILNKLQNNLLIALSSIESSDEFSLKLIPASINVKIDNKSKEFILDLYFNENDFINFEYSIKIPFEKIDTKLNFDTSNKDFDPSDQSQMKRYEEYKLLIDKYKKLLNNQSFITYDFGFKTSIVLKHNNYYEINLINEVKEVSLIRNDIQGNNFVGHFYINDLYSFNRTYFNFLIPNTLFEDFYYDTSTIEFYNKIKLSKKDIVEGVKRLNNEKLWKNPNRNFIYGLKVNFGLSNYKSLFGGNFSISYYYPLSEILYFGYSTDITAVYEENNESNYHPDMLTVGGYPVLGVSYIYLTDIGDKYKLFLDYKFGFSSDDFISFLNFGFEYPSFSVNNEQKYSNIKIQLQLTGQNKGLCSISYGFNPLDIFSKKN
ncbi:MAG: hypothetical protein ACPKOI_11385 [Pleomorphochaeta sp.]